MFLVKKLLKINKGVLQIQKTEFTFVFNLKLLSLCSFMKE